MDSLAGEQGVVAERINNLDGTGKVKLNDVFWTARSEDGSIIEQGAVVQIVRVDGVKLIVKMKEEEKWVEEQLTGIIIVLVVAVLLIVRHPV